MKKLLTIVISTATGLAVLAGYALQNQLSPVLSRIFSWGMLLLGVVALIGVGYLVKMHLAKLVNKKKGALLSTILLLAFLLTLIAGLAVDSRNSVYRNLVLNVQIPVEASLLAVLAVTLFYASLRLIRTQGWTPMSIGFLSSAVLSLFHNLGVVQTKSGTLSAYLVGFLRRLPLAGARGILLGIALGGLIVGLRVLFTIDKPYGE